MSTLPLKTSNQIPHSITFDKAFLSVFACHNSHIATTDWALLIKNQSLLYVCGYDPIESSVFVLIPEDISDNWQDLIDQKFTFAFVSLLQVCSRNKAKWLHLSSNNPIVTNIHSFELNDNAICVPH